jgi:cell division transport system permease protein
MSSIAYFFKESLTGFARHLSTTLGSIITLFLSLLIIGIFLFAGNIVNNIVKSVESEVNITVYVADNANDTDVKSLESYIKSLDGVQDVSFTTKDQALQDFRESYTSSPEIVDQLGDENPLPASINVTLSEPELVQSVADSIESNSTFNTICDKPNNPSDSLKYGQKTVERLFQVTNSIRVGGIALIVLLIFIALVFINNTIRLAILSRRKEISIMRLVGASNGFIRGPFLMEAILHAIIGTALAVACLELTRNLVLPTLATSLAWLPLGLSASMAIFIYVGLLVAGLVIVLLGSAFAMRRYLKA